MDSAISRKLLAEVDGSEAHNLELMQRLKEEREVVYACCLEAAAETHGIGLRIGRVASCSARGIDVKREIPKKPVFWAAVAAGKEEVAPEATARYMAKVSAKQGLDGMVWTNADVLRHNKELYDNGHNETVAVVGRILGEADGMLELPLETIPDKAYTPPDGDKRSYVSLSTYCWPANPDDLENPKGPWECRDGEAFPGRNVIAPDFIKLMHVQRHSYHLAMAWYFSRDKRYAERAAAIIRAFFLDPQTGMNPHLRYAQLSPGNGAEVGEAYGTIDNKAMSMVFDAIAMIVDSQCWLPEDGARMHVWASAYIQHLQSDHCKGEASQRNNHGTLFDVQYLSFLQFLRRSEAAKEYIEAAVKPRIRGQIFGSIMPQEMIRPISYSYHSFILEAYVRLAMQAEKLGVDLWSYGSATGNSMMDAWDWMANHWCDRNEGRWPVEQIEHPKLDMDRPVMFAGAMYMHASSLASVPRAYTQRSRSYALLFHSFRGGPNPGNEIKWEFTLHRQLSLVKFDDCFITTCPERHVLPEDPPTYPPFCLPGSDDKIGYLDALAGRWPDVKGTAEILPALARGDRETELTPDPVVSVDPDEAGDRNPQTPGQADGEDGEEEPDTDQDSAKDVHQEMQDTGGDGRTSDESIGVETGKDTVRGGGYSGASVGSTVSQGGSVVVNPSAVGPDVQNRPQQLFRGTVAWAGGPFGEWVSQGGLAVGVVAALMLVLIVFQLRAGQKRSGKVA